MSKYKILNNGVEYMIQSVVWVDQNLVIKLYHPDAKVNYVKLTFEVCLMIRVSAESHRLRYISESKFDFGVDNVFEHENSPFIKWFVEENYPIFEEKELSHYLILDTVSFIDVITIVKPVEEYEIE